MATVRQLQRTVGNHAVQRMLKGRSQAPAASPPDRSIAEGAEAGPPVAERSRLDALGRLPASAIQSRASGVTGRMLQRSLKIAGETMKWDTDFKLECESEFKAHGYAYRNFVNSLLASKITGESSRLEAVREAVGKVDDEYDTWEAFIEDLATKDLLAARVPPGSVSQRATKLGERPRWTSHVQDIRPSGLDIAARHVIPSHTLGFVVEKWPADVPELTNWIAKATEIDPKLVESVGAPKRQTVTGLKQHIWKIHVVARDDWDKDVRRHLQQRDRDLRRHLQQRDRDLRRHLEQRDRNIGHRDAGITQTLRAPPQTASRPDSHTRLAVLQLASTDEGQAFLSASSRVATRAFSLVARG